MFDRRRLAIVGAALVAAAAMAVVLTLRGPLDATRLPIVLPPHPAAPVPPTPVPVSALSFEPALTAAAALPRLYSLLISVDGTLLAERYFNGASASRPANMKSASKSIISALVGIALHRGIIGSVQDPISKYLPEFVQDDPDKAAITIEDLLTMRSGLESTSSGNYGRWVSSAHWVRFVLDQPMVDEPGGRMIYSTGSTHLLSAILTRAARMSTLAFAQTALAEPLGIALGPWQRDPQGIFLGGNEMPMRPRDMLRIGELYLNGGRYEDEQIIPRDWIQTSVVPRTRSRWGDREYGYGWWIRPLDGQPAYYAWGYGGQFIFVVPSVRLVAVTTSVPVPTDARRDHLDAIYALMERHVVPEARRAYPSVDGDE